MDCFASVSVVQQEELKKLCENKNTNRSTKLWLNVYRSWAEIRKKNKNPEEIFPDDLNQVLKQFFAEIRKQNGKEYEPDSLRVMQAALHRYLITKQYPGDIMNDDIFRESRNVLEGKARSLRAAGMGKKPNARDALSKEEEEKYVQKTLDDD